MGGPAQVGSWRARARDVVAGTLIASSIVGLLEGTGLLLVVGESGGISDGLAAWAVAASLASVGAFPIILAGLVGLAAATRLRLVADWRRALVEGGNPRAVLVWRAVLLAVTTLILGAFVFRLSAWTYLNYPDREPALFGGFVAVATLAVAGALAFAVAAVDRRIAPHVAAARWAARAVSGRKPRWVLIAVGLVSIAVLHRLLAVVTPGLSPAVSIGCASLPMLVVLLRATQVGSRSRERVAAVVLVAATAVGLRAIPDSAAGRGRVEAHGLISSSSFAALSLLIGDRDGDGYASRLVGGADCNDGKRRVNPSGTDIAGNGIDENCTGGDAQPGWVAERLAPRPASATEVPRHSILLVSIDALRADHVGAWGYARPTTPALDALAAGGTRFSWAFTTQPATRPAIASIMTGRYPAALAWRPGRNRLRWRRSRAVSLSEALRDAGYDGAMIACCDRFEKAENELAGFAHVDRSAASARHGSGGQANSDRVSQGAIRWLRTRTDRPRPFFLYMHFIDPHAPYEVPAGGTHYGDEDVDRYDAEVAFADRSLGAVLAALDELGLSKTTIVAVMADHGEEFGEHGFTYHARSLYNQVVRVPLVVRYPGAAPHVFDTPVSVVDTMPTLLDLVGVGGPGGMNGRSLAAAVRAGVEPADRPILLELVPNKAIRRDLLGLVHGGWKAIWDRNANSWSLHALTDSADATDLSSTEPERLAAMQKLLFETVDRQLSIAAK